MTTKTFKTAIRKLDDATRCADGLDGEEYGEMDAADLLAAADDAQAAALLARDAAALLEAGALLARDAAALLEAGATALIEKARLLRQDGCGEGGEGEVA